MSGASAVVSECGRYRYSLERTVGVGPNLGWIMLNPSTADAEKDDATIRKVKGFTTRAGYGIVCVANLFAWRSRHPKDVVLNLSDAEGDRNFEALAALAETCDVLVCAWGNEAGRNWIAEQADRVVDAITIGIGVTPCRLVCLGRNRDGSPRHPLMVPYAKRFEPYARARKAAEVKR